MGWYDIFSHFYDASLEPLYREQRRTAARALQVEEGMTVLDVPCGTGQSFELLAADAGTTGLLIGVDASSGMLAKARKRVQRLGLSNAHLIEADVHAIDRASLEQAARRKIQLDRLHIFLGLSAFPRWEDAFERLFDLLVPGGRCVVVDVHSERPTFDGRMVNLVARADITRRTWEPLAALSKDFERTSLPSLPKHGGELFLAAGTKP